MKFLKMEFLMMLGLLTQWSINNVYAYTAENFKDFTADSKMSSGPNHISFDHAKNIRLILTHKEGEDRPTGMVLNYSLPSQINGDQRFPSEKRILLLEITDIHSEECGATIYTANLPKSVISSQDAKIDFSSFESQTHVTLIDHSTEKCGKAYTYLWEAHVSQSFAGAGYENWDSALSLSTNPIVVKL